MFNKTIWNILLEFIIHIIVGVIIFGSISLIIVLLSKWTSYLETIGTNQMIIKGLIAFEYFLYGMDLLLGVLFVIVSAWKMVKKLWQI